MGIGAADAERTDAGATRQVCDRPIAGLRLHGERRMHQVQIGIGRFEVDAGRDASLLQRQRRLDRAGGARGDHQMADIALERTDPARAEVAAATGECPAQTFDLDRIADRCGGAVGFHVTDATRIDAGIVQRHRNHRRLTGTAGSGETGLVTAIVVDRAATYQRNHRVAVGTRIGKTFEQHHSGAIAEHGALRRSVKGPGAAIRRQHRALLINVTAARWAGDRHAAGQRHVALATAQAIDCLADRHQRGRTRGVNADRRAGEVELVRGAGGDEVLFIVEHHLECADLFDQLGMFRNVTLKVSSIVHAGKHADRYRGAIGRMAAALEAFPAQFQKQPMLRVHQIRLSRRNAEERGIEIFHAVDHATCGDIRGIIAIARVDARIELVRREHGDAVAARAQVVPECLDIGGTGETSGHGDDGDRFMRAPGVVVRSPVAVEAAQSIVVDAGMPRPRSGCGQSCRRGILKNRGDRQSWWHHAGIGQWQPAHAFQQTQRQQRIATEFEEVVVASHRLDIQQLGHQCTQRLLIGADWRCEFAGQLRALPVRRRQGAPVELAVGGHRQRRQQQVMRRHHEIRQALCQMRAQFRRGWFRPWLRNHVSDQPFVAGSIGARQHGAGTHLRMACQRRFDLAQLDAMAANLDLAVAAADKFDDTIGAIARVIAGAVQALAGRSKGVGDEALGGTLGLIAIAARQPSPADVQLAQHPDRHRFAARVQQVHAGVGDRTADRDRARVLGHRIDDERAREGGAFGRPIAVAQAHLGQRLAHPPHVIHR